MNTQISPKATGGCIVVLVIGIFFVSLINVSSLNPLEVFRTGSTASKVIVTICAVLIGTSLLQILALFGMQKHLEIGNSVKMQDMICPGCGLPLLKFSGAYGTPIKCPTCKQVWHDGPSCYNKDMPKQHIIIPIYPCPQCRTQSSELDMFDDEVPYNI